MRYRINQIKIDPFRVAAKEGGISQQLLEKALKQEIGRTLRKKGSRQTAGNPEIIRESVDLRKGRSPRLVYTVDFDCDAELDLPKAERQEYVIPAACGEQGLRPVIAGFGPCGMFAALILAQAGLRPIVIERGKAADERVRDVKRFWKEGGSPDPESNVQFGEGGAGTFSDGKLTTGIRDPRIRKVLEELVAAGADPKILYVHKPHIGTDRLVEIVKGIRRQIEGLGGEVRFGTRLDGIRTEGGRLTAVETTGGEIETDRLVLAIGHSAADTFRMLFEEGLEMEQKPFSIGVRIEHPQEDINAAQYGDKALADILGPAEYKLSHRCEGTGRGVYTFCMCPGGVVVNASTEPETSVTNGMSYSRRNGSRANSALLVDVRTSDFGSSHPLAGIEFQRKYERLAWENRTSGGMAKSTYGQFRKNSEDAVGRSLPGFARESILEAMPELGRKLKGFDSDSAGLTAVETRSSSPVRILRDESMQTPAVRGIIPAGEGPGYAGGIMSAAVEGIRAAEQIILLK